MAPGTCGEFVRNRQSHLLTLRRHSAVIPRKTPAQCTDHTQPENRIAGAQRLLGTVGAVGEEVRGCRLRRAVVIPRASHSHPPPERELCLSSLTDLCVCAHARACTRTHVHICVCIYLCR